ncbi:fungal-specific transcription factor domain-containing protein [Zopfochytrium polystomum]|nr:fungal-specific transcription factor domain-containing protein [Zopfochytrium polystomum]
MDGSYSRPSSSSSPSSWLAVPAATAATASSASPASAPSLPATAASSSSSFAVAAASSAAISDRQSLASLSLAPLTVLPSGGARRWSCEECRSRKRKCDGVRPCCGNCLKGGRAPLCVYLGYKNKIDFELALKHKREIVAARQHWDDQMSNVDPVWRVTPLTLDEMLFKASLPENLCSPGHYPAADILSASPAALNTVLPARPGADAHEQDILTEASFRSSVCFLPLLHRLSFLSKRRFVAAYLQAAVCAVGATESTLRSLPNSVLTYYYDFARSQVLEACDAPSLEHLQTLLILAELSFHLGKIPASRMLFGAACRMALYLKVQIDPDELPVLSPVERESRRRCWWVCIVTQRYASILSNRSPAMSEDHHVKSLCSDDLWLSMNPSDVGKLTPMPSGNHSLRFFELVSIHVDIVRIGTQSSAAAAPLAEDGAVADEMLCLERRLINWALSLPPDLAQSIHPDSVVEIIQKPPPPPKDRKSRKQNQTSQTPHTPQPSQQQELSSQTANNNNPANWTPAPTFRPWMLSLYCVYHASWILLHTRTLARFLAAEAAAPTPPTANPSSSSSISLKPHDCPQQPQPQPPPQTAPPLRPTTDLPRALHGTLESASAIVSVVSAALSLAPADACAAATGLPCFVYAPTFLAASALTAVAALDRDPAFTAAAAVVADQPSSSSSMSSPASSYFPASSSNPSCPATATTNPAPRLLRDLAAAVRAASLACPMMLAALPPAAHTVLAAAAVPPLDSPLAAANAPPAAAGYDDDEEDDGCETRSIAVEARRAWRALARDWDHWDPCPVLWVKELVAEAVARGVGG